MKGDKHEINSNHNHNRVVHHLFSWRDVAMNTGIKPAYTTGAHIYPMLIDGTWRWVVEHFDLYSDCFVDGKEVSLREKSEILTDLYEAPEPEES